MILNDQEMINSNLTVKIRATFPGKRTTILWFMLRDNIRYILSHRTEFHISFNQSRINENASQKNMRSLRNHEISIMRQIMSRRSIVLRSQDDWLPRSRETLSRRLKLFEAKMIKYGREVGKDVDDRHSEISLTSLSRDSETRARDYSLHLLY